MYNYKQERDQISALVQDDYENPTEDIIIRQDKNVEETEESESVESRKCREH